MSTGKAHTGYRIALLLSAMAVLGAVDLSIGSGLGAREAWLGLLGCLPEGSAALWRDILLGIRLPRMATAILVGAGLSLAGAQMQAIFRNPLSDPHIMGVSSGAGLGAAIATLSMGGAAIGGGWLGTGIGVTLAAFAGAVLSSLLVMAVARKFSSTGTLLVFGVMLGLILSAGTSVLEYSASEESLKMFYSWAAGSFSSTSWASVLVLALSLALGAVLVALNHRGLDVVLFGEEFALLSGTSTRRVRVLSLLGCCILTGVATAYCGPIGFVGIIAPHLSRSLVGSSVHSRMLLPTAILGGCICLCADILSQIWRVPLPVGSTLALLGIPVILYMLLHPHSSSLGSI